jgi:hypothetical protein
MIEISNGELNVQPSRWENARICLDENKDVASIEEIFLEQLAACFDLSLSMYQASSSAVHPLVKVEPDES